MCFRKNYKHLPSLVQNSCLSCGSMAELEEKVTVLTVKPVAMPAEKEEMLNAAVSRVDVLEQELLATKKVLFVL